MNKLLLSTLLAGAAALPAVAGVDNLNYQAVIRNNNEVVAGKEIGLKFQFVENDAVIYTEEAFVKTTQNGLAQWLIGTNNTLENVDWSSAAITLKVSVDLGEGYVALSDSEISSVPTALYALKSADTEQIYIDMDDLRGTDERFESQISQLQSKVAENEAAYQEDYQRIAENFEGVSNQVNLLTPAVEGLQQEFEDVQANVRAMGADVARIEGLAEDVENLQIDFDDMKGTDERFESQISQLQSKVTENQEAYQEDFQKMVDTFDGMSTQVNQLTTEVETLVQANEDNAETLKNMGAELARVDGFIEEQDAYNQSVSDTLAKLVGLDYEEIADFNQRVSDQIAKNIEDIETLQTTTDDLQGAHERYERQISVLQSTVLENQLAYQEDYQRIAENFEGMSNAINQINTDFDDLKGTDERFESQISQLQGKTEEMLTDMDDLRGTDERFESQISQLQAVAVEVETLVQDNEATKEQLMQIGADIARIDGLAEDIETIQTDYDDLKGTDERFETQISQLQSKTEEMLTDMDDLRGTDERFESQISQLQSKVAENQDAYQEDFQKMTETFDGMSTQVNELTTEVEKLVQANEDNAETLKNMGAELARVDGAIEEQDAFNQSVSDALAKLVGLDAAEIEDFNDRITEEVKSLQSAQNEQEIFNQGVSDELAKLVGLNAAEIEDFNDRITEEVKSLQQFQADAETFNQSVSDELAKLQGLNAEEINDFHQRVSDELTRLGEAVDAIPADLVSTVETNMKDIEDVKETLQGVNAEIARMDGVVGDLDDFNQRASEELTRLGEAVEEQGNFNQSVSDALAKLVGLDAEEIGDFNQRVSDQLAMNNEDIETLKNDYNDLVGTNERNARLISDLQSANEEMKTNFDDLKGTDERYETQISQLQSTVKDLQDQLDALREQLIQPAN